MLRARSEGSASRLLPSFTWLQSMDRPTLGADLSAGLTGALVMLPQGVAFAIIAGMPPEYGLYAGMIPAIIAALFGSSWHLVSGPTTAASIIILSAISAFAEPGSIDYVRLVLTLTFMVGVIELAMGLMRMGVLVNFISHTVAIGFTAGAAILISANQIKHFFGLDIPRGAPFYDIVRILAGHIQEISPAVTAVGLATVIVGIVAKRYLRRLPYMIVAMIAASVLAAVLNGFFGASVPTIGAIPSGLPPLSSPQFSLDVIRELAPTALAVALFALTEAVSISRALAVRSGQQIDGNREFIGQGLSNLAGSFFSGYVATGSFNRSGLNYEAGAKTPLAAIAAGVFLMPVVFLAAPYAIYLPKAAVAGILFLVAYGLIDIPHIRQVIKSSRSETTVMVVTFFAVLFLNLEIAIFAGVILSLFFYLNRTSHPNVASLAPDPDEPRRRLTAGTDLPECPQVKIVRIDGSLYFGAVSNVIEKLRRLEKRGPAQMHLAVVASGINFIDMEGAGALVGEARRRRQAGGQLYLIDLHETVAYRLERDGHIDAIGRENIFASKTAALADIYARLEPNACATCTKRIFRECDTEAPKSPTKEVPTEMLSTEIRVAKRATAEPIYSDTRNTKPLEAHRPRVLALVDFDIGAEKTVRAAAHLARSADAELALGHVASSDWSSGYDFAPGLVSGDAFAALRGSARARLGKIAAEADIKPTAVLAATTPDRGRGIRELVGEWRPEIIIVNAQSNFDIADRPFVDVDTPYGTVHCEIRKVGATFPELQENPPKSPNSISD
ncbi:MAG: sulfate permease [Rhodospirillales bacterium]|nr:sulfate permease [Rhodospirillales bacterium]